MSGQPVRAAPLPGLQAGQLKHQVSAPPRLSAVEAGPALSPGAVLTARSCATRAVPGLNSPAAASGPPGVGAVCARPSSAITTPTFCQDGALAVSHCTLPRARRSTRHHRPLTGPETMFTGRPERGVRYRAAHTPRLPRAPCYKLTGGRPWSCMGIGLHLPSASQRAVRCRHVH